MTDSRSRPISSNHGSSDSGASGNRSPNGNSGTTSSAGESSIGDGSTAGSDDQTSYLKTCGECGQLVRLTRTEGGAWQQLEPGDEKAPHDCGSVPPISTAWSLRSLGHRLTCRLDCWWCSEEVYLHTRGNGTFALFDALSWPWPAHRCWHERSEERGQALRKLESDLRARGYQGEGRLIGLAPSTVPDSIPTEARPNPPALQIRLSGTDHQMVDQAVRQITRFVSKRQRRAPLAVPLPVGKKGAPSPEDPGRQEPGSEEQAEDEGRSRGEQFTEHIHHRAIEMWEASPELIARLGQVQLPEAVDVTIRQATSR